MVGNSSLCQIFALSVSNVRIAGHSPGITGNESFADASWGGNFMPRRVRMVRLAAPEPDCFELDGLAA